MQHIKLTRSLLALSSYQAPEIVVSVLDHRSAGVVQLLLTQKGNPASVGGRDSELSHCRDNIVARRSRAEDGRHSLFEEASLVGRADNRSADHQWDAFTSSLEGSEKVVQIMDVLPRMTADADYVSGLFNRSRSDRLGGGKPPEVDHLHARIAKHRGDSQSSRLMLIEAENRDQHSYPFTVSSFNFHCAS